MAKPSAGPGIVVWLDRLSLMAIVLGIIIMLIPGLLGFGFVWTIIAIVVQIVVSHLLPGDPEA